MTIFSDNSATIGNTPLIKLNRLAVSGVNILLKTEGRNPAYSVKCRIATNMVNVAEKDGTLKQDMTIIEPTSGNTGIGLAMVAAAKGYKIALTMPSSMSLERRKILKALGADLVLTDPTKGMKGAVEKAQEIYQSNPQKYFLPQQFENPANPAIHEQTTGPEIWRDTNGEIDVLVAGVGTGGTISGVSKYIKQTCGKSILSIAVEPSASPLIYQSLNNQELKPAPHKIQGLGANFIPKNLNLSMVDEAIGIDDETAKQTAVKLMLSEGILCGISSGAALACALQVAQRPDMKNKTIVVILPDSGERYLSSFLFADIFTDKESVQ